MSDETKTTEMVDVMIDIECLSTEPGGALVSVGACYFDIENIGDTFYGAVDWEYENMPIDPKTLCWWLRQPNWKQELIEPPRHSLLTVLFDLAAFLDRYVRIWAKGPDFDLVNLQSHYKQLGIKVPWHYRNTRDVRTMLHLSRRLCSARVKRDYGVVHNALDDAVYQAKQMQLVFRTIGEMTGVGRLL